MDIRQETRWVLLAQSGDREALNEIFKALEAPLYRYILSLVGNHFLAQDILQDVFVLIYRKLYWLREPGLFRAWVYRITSREAFRRLRKERKWADQVREDAFLEAIPAPSPEEFQPDLAERLPDFLDQVSPASRAVLVLHFLQEMPLQEVADVLELPLGTVKSRLAYGLATLRKVIGKRGGESLQAQDGAGRLTETLRAGRDPEPTGGKTL